MTRIAVYAYTFLFAIIINPFQSWLGFFSGRFFGEWQRLLDDLAGGALFGYGALIAIEILIRTELFPAQLIKARPNAVRVLRIGTVSVGVCGMVLATLFWTMHRTYDQIDSSAQWVGTIFCITALLMLLYAVNIESVAKKETDALLEGTE